MIKPKKPMSRIIFAINRDGYWMRYPTNLPFSIGPSNERGAMIKITVSKVI